jgi:DNA-binding transcriptional ArsR family regulator
VRYGNRVVTDGMAALDALGDPQRREILRLLGERDRPVHAIAEALPISRPAVSRHLRVLLDSGLVEQRPVGTERIYSLADEGVRAVQEYLESVWGDAIGRFRLVAENTSPPQGALTRRRER